jgi:hypothetical protein
MSCPDNPSLDVFGTALEAWGRLGARAQHSFTDWLLVGTALAGIQTDAMVAADANQPFGRRYCKQFGVLLREAGLADLAGIDKGCRSRLFKVMEHRDEIEAWLATLGPARRVKLNHPGRVWGAWSKAMGLETTKPEPEPKSEFSSIWKNATAEERRTALDDGGDALLFESISPEMRAKITKRLKPAKTNDEVLGEHIRKNVDQIRPLLLHYEQHKDEVHRALTAIKRATHGVGKAPSTTRPRIDPVVGKAVKEMGNGVDPGESAATAMAVHAAREANI